MIMVEPVRRRILVTGANGQIGWELLRCLQPLGEIVATTSQAGTTQRALNLADPDAIRAIVRELRPQLIVNAAAYTAVDQAEDDVDLAMAINAVAPGVLAEEAKRCGAALVHYSTDYVFDGSKTGAYQEEDLPNPLSAYGRSKLAGEQAIQQVGVAHLILRTSWVYGARGKNFLRTILRLARERPELNVVDDQIGTPNWSRLLAEATALALATQLRGVGKKWDAELERLRDVSGLYHLSAGGATSWCGFARGILGIAESSCRVNGITTAEYPLRAPRPMNSRLITEKFSRTFGLDLPAWDEALKLCMADVL
jgi:dTDP-4-dehydrorhamnose reductase